MESTEEEGQEGSWEEPPHLPQVLPHPGVCGMYPTFRSRCGTAKWSFRSNCTPRPPKDPGAPQGTAPVRCPPGVLTQSPPCERCQGHA